MPFFQQMASQGIHGGDVLVVDEVAAIVLMFNATIDSKCGNALADFGDEFVILTATLNHHGVDMALHHVLEVLPLPLGVVVRRGDQRQIALVAHAVFDAVAEVSEVGV